MQAAAAAGASSPLRVYCEYLSYIFRKAPLPPEQELVELSYRDYLQARPLSWQHNVRVLGYR